MIFLGILYLIGVGSTVGYIVATGHKTEYPPVISMSEPRHTAPVKRVGFEYEAINPGGNAAFETD